ncbi:hypothetical protein V490_00486, partial [Pseudogymnoascus sp. VKM F-3557]
MYEDIRGCGPKLETHMLLMHSSALTHPARAALLIASVPNSILPKLMQPGHIYTMPFSPDRAPDGTSTATPTSALVSIATWRTSKMGLKVRKLGLEVLVSIDDCRTPTPVATPPAVNCHLFRPAATLTATPTVTPAATPAATWVVILAATSTAIFSTATPTATPAATSAATMATTPATS